MSFILDALRKAETRNRDTHIRVATGPEVLVDSTPDKPVNPKSIASFLVLGGLLVAVGAWFGMRSSAPTNVDLDPASVPPSASSQRDMQAMPPEQETIPATRSLLSPAPATAAPERSPIRDTGARALDRETQKAQPITTDGPTPGTVTMMPTSGPSAAGRPTPGTVTVIPAPGQVLGETLPTYDEVVAMGNVGVPPLNLDVHVYSSQPAKRFVFINLAKYQEGDAISGNLNVESINPVGAILNYKGFRFRIQPD